MENVNGANMGGITGAMDAAFARAQAMQAEITAKTTEHQMIMSAFEAMQKAAEKIKG